MAGEHILKLLNKTNARIVFHGKEMYYSLGLYSVFENSAIGSPILIETEDEELACKILKGE